jgi:hypothetical protein
VIPAARAAAALAFAIALGSAAKDYRGTWNWLSGQRAQFVHLSDSERAQEPGVAQLLPVDAFDFFRAHVHQGERYYVVAKPGRFQAGVDRAQATRIFSRYYLLPAIQVADPRDADVVLTVGIDPRTLALPLGPVSKFGGGEYYAAALRR